MFLICRLKIFYVTLSLLLNSFDTQLSQAGQYSFIGMPFITWPIISYAGISRSSSIVIAYLMKEHGVPMVEALNHTRRRRPIVFPNPGFQR